MSLEQIEQLISRVALGDRAAFGTLYDRTSAKLLGICLRVLSERASAEDALQETFVKVWRNADRYVANGLSPMSWLITIARNTAIDQLRARRGDTGSDGLDLVIASGPTPEQSALAGSEAGRIVRCLDELDDQRRDAVSGAYLRGESYVDLSERLEVPLNTIRTWLRRGLIALRECMAR